MTDPLEVFEEIMDAIGEVANSSQGAVSEAMYVLYSKLSKRLERLRNMEALNGD